ncbi:MAG: 3-oxoacyl-[acyl-carrier-protein] synthase III C-terminal domain-containing protein [Elusimicrobia bacterium]|nr:3-oxoacyl-[acyl-carrier-protein] synthase III C-terminal domain-containing protein [Elusimicrobiota bacterium]
MLNLLGLGYALAKTELDNEFLHKEVGIALGPDWVKSRLGINKRFTVLSKDYIKQTKNADPRAAIALARSQGQTPVTLGAQAARQALEHAGVKAEQIGLVVANNDTPFETIPSTANLVAKALGIGSGPHFDANTSCSSFARHMQLLCEMEPSLPEYVLAVQTSAYTTRTDYTARCMDGYIWGDGAAAQVLSAKRPGRLQVTPVDFGTKPEGADDVVIDTAGHFHQKGAAVKEFALAKTCELFQAAVARHGLDLATLYTISHQNNFMLQSKIVKALGAGEERHLRNVQDQGNTAAAGVPSVLAQCLPRLKAGDRVVYAVVGSGLAWGAGLLEVL